MLEVQHNHFASLHQHNTQALASFQTQTNPYIDKLDEHLQGQTQIIQDFTAQVHLLQEMINVFSDTLAASQAALRTKLTTALQSTTTQVFETSHVAMQDQLSQILRLPSNFHLLGLHHLLILKNKYATPLLLTHKPQSPEVSTKETTSCLHHSHDMDLPDDTAADIPSLLL